MIFLSTFKISKDILKTRWDILYNWIYWRVLNLLSANKVLDIRNIFLYNFCNGIYIFLTCIVFLFPWKIAEQLFFADVLYRAWFTLCIHDCEEVNLVSRWKAKVGGIESTSYHLIACFILASFLFMNHNRRLRKLWEMELCSMYHFSIEN